MSVVLPEPLGPTMQKISLADISTFIFSKTGYAPKLKARLLAVMSGVRPLIITALGATAADFQNGRLHLKTGPAGAGFPALCLGHVSTIAAYEELGIAHLYGRGPSYVGVWTLDAVDEAGLHKKIKRPAYGGWSVSSPGCVQALENVVGAHGSVALPEDIGHPPLVSGVSLAPRVRQIAPARFRAFTIQAPWSWSLRGK